jgi:integrase
VARTRNPAPTYIPHGKSGRGRLQWYDNAGVRHEKLLPGPFGSPESLAAKARLELELVASPVGIPSVTGDATGVSVNEVLLAFLNHAEDHYRRTDGTTTNEFDEYKIVARHVRELYGDAPASTFGPLALKAIRQKFIDAKWSRNFINQRVGRVRRIFKWAASEELVPAAVYQSLATVTGLQRGRTEARETEPVGSVPDSTIDATLPLLNRHVRGLVEFQRLTGCRPGEACELRRCDIDTGGAVWLYRPPHHKTAWRGKRRTVAIGPKAQELLKQFFIHNISAYLFSPARAVEELRAERSAQRQTPRYPSHVARNAAKRKKNPKCQPDEKYDRGSYGVAIDRACDRAFPPPAPLAQRADESAKAWWDRLDKKQRDAVKAWRKAHRWHPNQLRHTFATRVRGEHGLEAAQVLLGHSRADVTQVYAERNERLAVAVAEKIG